MASGAKLLGRTPARIMIVGYPGTGKTGAIASLANAGFKIRMLDYDGNYESLLNFTKPEMLPNIDIISLEDKLRAGVNFIEPNGVPDAFAKGLKAMDNWEYEEDGEKVSLGRSRDWGMDTVVVLDSLTSMGVSAFRRAMVMQGKSPGNITQQVWMLAMNEQDQFIEKLTSPHNRFHVVVLAHLKMISPKDIQKGDDPLTQELKREVADLIPTKLFPNALGQNLPPTIAGHFPTVLLAENDFKNGNLIGRKLKTQSKPELDLKVPAKNLPKDFDLETGLLKVFEMITPGVEACLADHGAVSTTSVKE